MDSITRSNWVYFTTCMICVLAASKGLHINDHKGWWEVEIEGESDEDYIPPLKDSDDDGVEYLVEGEALEIRHTLNV